MGYTSRPIIFFPSCNFTNFFISTHGDFQSYTIQKLITKTSVWKLCLCDMKPSQEYLEPNEKTSQYGWPVVHRQKNPPNWAEWAVCANSYLKIGWFFKLVLCNFRTCSVAINDISRNFSWLLIFRSCSFKNRRVLYYLLLS